MKSVFSFVVPKRLDRLSLGIGAVGGAMTIVFAATITKKTRALLKEKAEAKQRMKRDAKVAAKKDLKDKEKTLREKQNDPRPKKTQAFNKAKKDAIISGATAGAAKDPPNAKKDATIVSGATAGAAKDPPNAKKDATIVSGVAAAAPTKAPAAAKPE